MPQMLYVDRIWQNQNAVPRHIRFHNTVEFHELGQKVRILGQGQEQDSSVD